MATVQRYVDTASSGGDGTTQGHSGSTAAYASLSSWEANSGGSATDDYIVDCAGSTADTTAVTVDFATNITSGSILIRGNRSASDSDGFYSGNATISTSHYRLSTGSGDFNSLTINEPNGTVDGIQVQSGHTGSFGHAIRNISAGAGAVRNCRAFTSSGCDTGIGTTAASSGSATRTVENNLVVGFDSAGIQWYIANHNSPTHNFYHNTIYGCAVGINVHRGGLTGSPVNNVKGNAIAASSGNDLAAIGTNGTVNYADNATDDYDLGTTNEIDLGATTDAWTSPGTATTNDFTVKDTGSSLYNAVNPTLVSTDITDFTRDGTNHDVGCFEYQSAATDLVISDASHAHSTDGVALTQTHLLAVADSGHGHTTDGVALTQDQQLAVADGTHAHAADSLALTQTHELAIGEATHGHLADNVALTQTHLLVIAESLHAHAADNLVLTGAGDLVIADATHAHAADNLALTQTHLLVTAEALHGHAADNLVLVEGGTNLLIAEALHGHLADGVALTQTHLLAIAEALHGHLADNLVLSVIGDTAPTNARFLLVPFENRVLIIPAEARDLFV